MHKIVKQFMVLFMAMALVLIPLTATALAQDFADQPEISADMMAADLVLVRPLGIAATVIGTVFYVVAYPFSAMGGNTEESYQKLVVEPAKHAFKRPLGEF
jgi:predicted outer membrane protein